MTTARTRRTARPATRPITSTPGNPAHALCSAYQELMAIQDQDVLALRITAILAGPGISDSHRAQSQAIVRQKLDDCRAGRNPLFSLRKYITDFVLKADGLGVVTSPVERERYARFAR